MSLLNGMPQNDEINRNEKWKYYQLVLPSGHEDIDVRCTTLVGSIDLFVKRCSLKSISLCASKSLPNTTYFTESTVGMGRNDNLNLLRNDAAVTVIYLILM